LVLDAARMHQEAALGPAPPLCGTHDVLFRDPGDLLGPLQLVVLHRRRRFLETARVVLDELVVKPVMLDELVQYRTVER
jgi:hypothetical protein